MRGNSKKNRNCQYLWALERLWHEWHSFCNLSTSKDMLSMVWRYIYLPIYPLSSMTLNQKRQEVKCKAEELERKHLKCFCYLQGMILLTFCSVRRVTLSMGDYVASLYCVHGIESLNGIWTFRVAWDRRSDNSNLRGFSAIGWEGLITKHYWFMNQWLSAKGFCIHLLRFKSWLSYILAGNLARHLTSLRLKFIYM